ncbi:MAG: hypothetical protein ABL917_01080 [Parcubacteria group bacterium]
MESPAQILQFENLFKLDLSSIVNAKVLSATLFIVFIVYAIISGILMYHWSNYGMKSLKVYAVEAIFLLVSIILFTASALSIYYF